MIYYPCFTGLESEKWREIDVWNKSLKSPQKKEIDSETTEPCLWNYFSCDPPLKRTLLFISWSLPEAANTSSKGFEERVLFCTSVNISLYFPQCEKSCARGTVCAYYVGFVNLTGGLGSNSSLCFLCTDREKEEMCYCSFNILNHFSFPLQYSIEINFIYIDI